MFLSNSYSLLLTLISQISNLIQGIFIIIFLIFIYKYHHRVPIDLSLQLNQITKITFAQLIQSNTGFQQIIDSVKQLQNSLQQSSAMSLVKSSSILQQYLNTFSQIAIIFLTSNTKAPNFYYILKLITSIYFTNVSDWNEPTNTASFKLFGKDFS